MPLSFADAERLIAKYVQVYHEQRLHSAIGYVTPQAPLEGRQTEILAARNRKLEQARRLAVPAAGSKSTIVLQDEAA